MRLNIICNLVKLSWKIIFHNSLWKSYHKTGLMKNALNKIFRKELTFVFAPEDCRRLRVKPEIIASK